LRVDLSKATLEDKYTVERGRVFLTGTQALIRLLMLQRTRDQIAGLNTAGFVSGYRGSPLGGLDQALWRAQPHLARHDVRFQPGVNEDLAATAIWGTQQVTMYPKAKYDGVFGMWYGKGPGVDRCGDVFKHANAAGTAKHGGVLVLAGDDHAAKSSTLPHQSEHIFKACLIPHLNPSSVQDYLDLGLHGYAMSRFSGCWVAFKCVTDVVESGASVLIDPERVKVRIPDFAVPPGGLNIRWPDGILEQEARILDYKVYAAIAYARANGLDRVVWDSPRARLGIATTGKSFGDVMQALADLGITEEVARAIGLRVYKVALSWPLEPQGARRFAEGLEEILVVEEKRQVIEYQIKEELYNWKEGVRAPRVVGKFDDNGEWSRAEGQPAGTWLLPAHYEHSPAMVAKAIAQRLEKLNMVSQLGSQFRERLAFLDFKDKLLAKPRVTAIRQPYFCSGCPHNTSTRVPEGSRALAGIGCHTMAMLIDPRKTTTVSHMGAEGVMWLGQQPFTNEKHVFANMGDGTYAHSGFLAIRQAIAAEVPITYKLLYNGFVSMTGGQLVDGNQTPQQILTSLSGEGVRKMAIVTDDPERYAGQALPAGVAVHPRTALEAVQKEFREYAGVSLILYDQACATERRRLRKRGKLPDPPKRSFINAAVCEGCGDCGQVSNCMSVEPLETELGRKRRINQSSCNKDFTCIEGFCPSFVTVHGGKPRKAGVAVTQDAPAWTAPLPEPTLPTLSHAFSVLVGGIGGTGVVTIGQTLAMAAHVQGAYSSNLDVTGLAQKYGAVLSHVRIAPQPEMLHATRIGNGEADTMIGCDLIVAAGEESLAKMRPGSGAAVVCTDLVPTADFARNPDWQVDSAALVQRLQGALGERALLLEGQRLASALLGDPIAANMFMLGAAWQRGQIPLTLAAIERAVELNGVALAMNKEAFTWGRRAAHDLAAVEAFIKARSPAAVITLVPRIKRSVNELIEHRSRQLVAHTGHELADRYAALVAKVRQAESRLGGGDVLTRAVAHNHHRVLAVKDEWEVARLYSEPEFKASLEREFEGDYKLGFHLGAWPFAKTDAATGKTLKAELGPWALTAFRWLARFKGLRGSFVDPFRNNAERRLDQLLLTQYEADIERLLQRLTPDKLALAAKIAALPQSVRGYGHVKQAQADAMGRQREALWAAWHATPGARQRAA
jgi:indolepyruvate ferredoxin oxidoreductase